MTNGEKIQQDFECEVCEPIIEDDIIHVIFADKPHSAIGFDWSWWNAEHKKPTTKNNLGVDLISRAETLKAMETWDKFGNDPNEGLIPLRTPALQDRYVPYVHYEDMVNCLKNMPSVTPQLSSGLEKNSQKLEKDIGDLDCISRAQTQAEIEMNASRYTIAKERGGMGQVEWSDQLIKVSDAVDIIRHLPPVTPQEPKTGHWIEEFNVIEGEVRFTCSSCGKYQLFGTDFCYNCGSDNREVEDA